MKYLVPLILATMCVGLCRGYSSSAPSSACGEMLPRHGSRHSPQDHSQNPAPFVISIEDGHDTYRPGDTYKVNVQSTDRYIIVKGFLLEARTISGDPSGPVGTFVDMEKGTKLICENKAVTHYRTWRVRGDKFQANWVAPRSDIGEIVFVATVVKTYSTYWSNVRSVVMRPHRPSTAAPTPPPTRGFSGATTDNTSICDETLLTSLPAERPHVAILCDAHSQCPCGWYCCPSCVNKVCVGHSICRRPLEAETGVEDGESGSDEKPEKQLDNQGGKPVDVSRPNTGRAARRYTGW